MVRFGGCFRRVEVALTPGASSFYMPPAQSAKARLPRLLDMPTLIAGRIECPAWS